MDTRKTCILVALSLPVALLAQEKPSPTYRLHLRLTETPVASQRTPPTTRNFSLVLQGRSRGKINVSRRIPYYTPGKGDTKELHTVALGMIIECTAGDSEGGVRLDCAIESSFVARDQPAAPPPVPVLPVMHSRQVSTSALIPLSQEVQLALLDDPALNSRLEIFASAERFAGPIK